MARRFRAALRLQVVLREPVVCGATAAHHGVDHSAESQRRAMTLTWKSMMQIETGTFTLPDMLVQPPDAVRALQDRLLQHMVALCYDHHPFYSRLMRQHGLRPEHLSSCADLVRLPPSSKKDFLSDPEAFRLNPAALPGNEGTLWKVVYTTGTTTGRPRPDFRYCARPFCLHVRFSGSKRPDRTPRHGPYR